MNCRHKSYVTIHVGDKQVTTLLTKASVIQGLQDPSAVEQEIHIHTVG